MDTEGILNSLDRLVNSRLFELGGIPVTLATLFTVVIIFLLTLLISRVLRRALEMAFRRRGVASEGTVVAMSRLLHYVLLVIGLSIALQTAGVNLGALFAAGAIFAVGLGFAMQSIAQNFVAGVILLAERAIKPGDVLEVEGRVVKVAYMGIRTTIVRTRDGEHLIVPNTVLVQATVKNYTLKDAVFRVRVAVGVSYGSDMKWVRQTLEETARDIEWRLPDREPLVLLTEFGDSSVSFEVSVWMGDPWMARPARSRLNQAIWDAFCERGIVIAFPQVDLHLDPPVVEGLRTACAAGS